jgi:hypothetical protein
MLLTSVITEARKFIPKGDEVSIDKRWRGMISVAVLAGVDVAPAGVGVPVAVPCPW